MKKETATAAGIGIIIGFLTGVTAALLYAPKSGEETRGIIKEKAIGIKNKAVDIKDKAINLIKKNKEE